MKRSLRKSACGTVILVLIASASLASTQTGSQLTPHKVKLKSVDYLGKRAVKITEEGTVANGEAYAMVKDAMFIMENRGGARGASRGRCRQRRARLWGIAFRLQSDRFEYIYLRPTNGRADDQVRRNHSTAVTAHTELRLREELCAEQGTGK